MKEVTVKELVQALKGQTVEVESVDTYGMSFGFSKARIEYDEDMNELSFVAGRHDLECGMGCFSIRVDDVVDSITFDGENDEFQIEFNQYMPDVIVRKAV